MLMFDTALFASNNADKNKNVTHLDVLLLQQITDLTEETSAIKPKDPSEAICHLRETLGSRQTSSSSLHSSMQRD